MFLGSESYEQARAQGADSLKSATKKFQSAAGIIVKLTELMQVRAISLHRVRHCRVSQAGDGDLSAAALACLRSLCLAQAQECILLKAIKDNKNPSLVARISAQVSEYYDVAFTATAEVNPDAKKHPWAKWPATMQLKALYYRAIAQYYMSVTAFRESRFGEQVARLRAAKDFVASYLASNKKTKAVPADDGQPFFTLAAKTLERAEQDNSTVGGPIDRAAALTARRSTLRRCSRCRSCRKSSRSSWSSCRRLPSSRRSRISLRGWCP